MMKKAFDQYLASPVVIAFHAKQNAMREIYGLPANAQLAMPDCNAFSAPDSSFVPRTK
jgi:hypothetical protein